LLFDGIDLAYNAFLQLQKDLATSRTVDLIYDQGSSVSSIIVHYEHMKSKTNYNNVNTSLPDTESWFQMQPRTVFVSQTNTNNDSHTFMAKLRKWFTPKDKIKEQIKLTLYRLQKPVDPKNPFPILPGESITNYYERTRLQ